MARLLWPLRQTLLRLGWAGWLGAALLLAGLLLHFLLLQPMQARVSAPGRPAQLADAAPPVSVVGVSEADQLQQFYRFFVPQSGLPQSMEKIYALAAAQNLMLEQGEYRLLQMQEGKLARYEMTLPIKGAYLPVRRFVAQALQEVPGLALDGITFNRKKVDEAQVEVQLRLTLYLGGQ